MSIKIGTIVPVRTTSDSNLLDRVAAFGLKTCQLSNWNPALYEQDFEGFAAHIRACMAATGVQPCALWAGYSGRIYWNFTEGPITLGLIPPEHRHHRILELQRAADFAKALGFRAIITHVGFLPENPTDPNYRPVLVAIAAVAEYCQRLGLGFWFETGQETPVTLLRTIQALGDLGLDNIGINLDPANLILYGKGSPCDALRVFGKYVRNVHVKDGMPPTDGLRLGKEVQVGQGCVDFPRFVPMLLDLGFDGEFIIEREIPAGEEQARDIRETIGNLRKWAGEA